MAKVTNPYYERDVFDHERDNPFYGPVVDDEPMGRRSMTPAPSATPASLTPSASSSTPSSPSRPRDAKGRFTGFKGSGALRRAPSTMGMGDVRGRH